MRTATRRATVYGGRRVPQLPTIAGLQLWLKADAITGLADADAITTWTDSSGNGRNATQGTAGAKPTYKTGIINSMPVARFDGGDWLVLDGNLHTILSGSDIPVSMFVVHKNSTTSAIFQTLFSVHNNTPSAFYEIAADCRVGINSIYALYGDGTTTKGIGGLVTQGSWMIAEFLCTGTSGRILKNGQLLAGPTDMNTGAATFTRAVVGTRLDASLEKTTGDIAEIIVYDSALSDANRQAVEEYLSAKYGIALA